MIHHQAFIATGADVTAARRIVSAKKRMQDAIDRATLPRAMPRRNFNPCIVWEEAPTPGPDPEWHFFMFQAARKHGTNVKEILSDMRNRNIVHARHEVFWRMAKERSLSLTKIARRFEKDHTTVLHGIRQHEARIARGEA